MSIDKISMQDKKKIIIDFLQKCNGYTEEMLAGYEEVEAGSDSQEALKARQKINDWSSYRDFNVHTIGELNEGTLDSWF